MEISKNYGRAQWREDLKMMLRKAGVDGTSCMFLFADTQIKDEAFVEDINNILNAGEVPNMFPSDERMQARPLHSYSLPPACIEPCFLLSEQHLTPSRHESSDILARRRGHFVSGHVCRS